jgi:Zn-dependent protease
MSPENLQHLRDGVVYLVALILSICVHEFGHAYVADRLGDRLPRSQGRVTLNPIAHIDPIGTLLIPMIQFFSPGVRLLGWGKPVQISLSARDITRRMSVKTANLLIAAAGPAMNLLFGLVLTAVFAAMLRFAGETQLPLTVYVATVINMNIGLAFFNLLPCPPLDGGAVLAGLLPRRYEFIAETLQRYGFMILLALVLTGGLSYFMIPARIASAFWIGTVTGWVLP